MTRLSIVTAVFNRACFVADAVDSVLTQGLATDEYEHIVVDGASTDGTLEVLDRYPHLRVMSEPDRGVYDAMNKGIRAATGDVIALLNSDDRLPPGSLRSVLDAATSDVDMIVGGAAIVDATAPERRLIAYHPAPRPPLRLFDITRGVAITNARFTRREVFDRLGLFDTDLRIAADREWLIRAWRAGLRAVRLDSCLYEYGHHEGSLTIGGTDIEAVHTEYLKICGQLLATPDLSPSLHRELVDWQAQVRARHVRDVLRTHGFGEALRTGAELLQSDRAWPLRAVVQRVRRPKGPTLGGA